MVYLNKKEEMHFRLHLNDIRGQIMCKVSFVKSILYNNKIEDRNNCHLSCFMLPFKNIYIHMTGQCDGGVMLV